MIYKKFIFEQILSPNRRRKIRTMAGSIEGGKKRLIRAIFGHENYPTYGEDNEYQADVEELDDYLLRMQQESSEFVRHKKVWLQELYNKHWNDIKLYENE